SSLDRAHRGGPAGARAAPATVSRVDDELFRAISDVCSEVPLVRVIASAAVAANATAAATRQATRTLALIEAPLRRSARYTIFIP
ncbi:MAG TPA: hypothetical protein VN714_11130, partial [Trebonia sp.]|nr:hypothetical protein [Trebonia sp.]